MPGTSANRSETASVSEKIAAANTLVRRSTEKAPRFPGEDGGRSLSAMAHRDLDAALQLLADRAQYITGASAVAIALRRGQHNDMLCRASIGSAAPELGALLSMEYGLSGECVRTRQALRCDDAERDPRVNREVCRELGIASVVVMPIASEEHVLGVFELLSGKPRAFEERDLSALQRLSEMVATAVKHAVAAQTMPAAREADAHSKPPDAILERAAKVISATFVGDIVPAQTREQSLPEPQEDVKPGAAPKKPLFWSLALRSEGSSQPDNAAALTPVPPVLRKLQKCQACGFPVSQERIFCVECEEKQWRGQVLPQPAAGVRREPPEGWREEASSEPQVVRAAPHSPAPADAITAAIEVSASAAIVAVGEGSEAHAIASSSDAAASSVPAGAPVSDNSVPFLSSALQSESWFAANKYILGALLVVALVLGAIAWLR